MSTGREPRRSGGQFQKQSGRRWAVTRYDVLLALIPLALLIPLVASGIFGVSLHAALAGGSAFGVAVLADALFLNPPIEP